MTNTTINFRECETISDVKKLYHKLAKVFHPDKGGTKEQMQTLNKLYQLAVEKIKRGHMDDYGTQKEAAQAEFCREVLEKLSLLDGLEIEICGRWLWIGGRTKDNKDALKELGCKWARKKQKWAWHLPEDYSNSHGKYSMDDIYDKYGRETVRSTGKKAIGA